MPRPTPSRRTVHVPVMLHEVLEHLAIQPPLIIVDGTVGAGGHSQHILKMMKSQGQLIGLDRDQSMLDRAAQVVHGPLVSLHQSSYAELDRILDELKIHQVDRVLLDLGLSSDQLVDPERGFGFDTQGSLDMRFDTRTGQSVKQLLRTATEAEMEEIFRTYGEDKNSARIASALVARRQSRQPIETANQLVDLVTSVAPSTGAKKSPSVVRVFQALRIAVNRELDQLQTFLSEVLPQRLRSGGRTVMITFHSLEDRLVKEAFRDEQIWNNLTRKPLSPTASEVRMNPRSRSAKLRVAERR